MMEISFGWHFSWKFWFFKNSKIVLIYFQNWVQIWREHQKLVWKHCQWCLAVDFGHSSQKTPNMFDLDPPWGTPKCTRITVEVQHLLNSQMFSGPVFYALFRSGLNLKNKFEKKFEFSKKSKFSWKVSSKEIGFQM